jgi:hypothetical protein
MLPTAGACFAPAHKNGGIAMKAFFAAVAFSVVAACVWFGVLDMQQRQASEAFAAPSSVRL